MSVEQARAFGEPAVALRPARAVTRRRQRDLSVGRVILYAITGLVLFYLVFPIFVVIPVSFISAAFLQFPPPGLSFQCYDKFFSRRDWVDAMFLILLIALIITVIATTLGTLAALALVRGRFRGRNLINSFIVSPMIIPSIIVAIGIYFFYARLQ